MSIVLAALSSLLWGTGDFIGGSVARRAHVLAVTLGSQAAGFGLLIVVVLVTGSDVSAGGVAFGAAAGLVGAFALAVFYRALALGVMSLVAPLSATGAIVPVVVALARGDEVGTLALVGMAVAIAGAVGCGLVPGAVVLTRQALGLAAVAALGIGSFLALIQLGSQADGSSGPGAVLAARAAGSSAALVVVLSLRGAPMRGVAGRTLLTILSIGLMDASANLLFAVASEARDGGAVVAVIGSLYPLMTLLLAFVLHGERLVRLQALSVVAALGGAALAGAA